MLKRLFKKTKVIYNAHGLYYEVWFKKFWVWCYDSCYKFDKPGEKYPVYYTTKEEAEERAIERAKAMIETVEVWRS